MLNRCMGILLLTITTPLWAQTVNEGAKNTGTVPAAVPAAASSTLPSATEAPSAKAASAELAGQLEYTCAMSKLKRSVSVVYEKQDSKVPCKVNYVRDVDSGDSKVLYSAAAEEGFCETKASEFVEKLKSTGWDCSQR